MDGEPPPESKVPGTTPSASSPAPASSPPPEPSRTPSAGPGYRNWLLVILGVGLYLRLLVFVDLAAHDPLFALPEADARMFLDWAARIVAGDGAGGAGDAAGGAAGGGAGGAAYFFNPLYAWFLAPFVAVFGPDPLSPIRFAQAGLGLATVVLTAETARRFLRDARAGLVAGALAALWPYLLYAETVVVGIEVSVFLNALALFLLARYAERPGGGRALAAGLALGLGSLARPNVLLFVLLLPAWIALGPAWISAIRSGTAFATAGPPRRGVFRRMASPEVLRPFALVAAGVLAILLPVLARNLAVSGEPVLVTSSMGANLWLSNNPTARETGMMGSAAIPLAAGTMEDAARAAAEEAEGRPLRAAEVSSHWTRRALRAAAEEPGPTAAFLLRKGLCFLDGSEFPSTDFFGAARGEAETLRWIPLGFGTLAAFALLGAGVVAFRRPEALPLVLLFLAYAASLALFFPLAHYRAPVLPAAFGLAAAGALALVDAVRSRDRAGAARLIAGLAAAGLLAGGARLALAAGIPSLGPLEIPDFRRALLKSDRLVTRAWSLRAEGKDGAADRTLEAADRYIASVMADASADEPDRWSAESALAKMAAARMDHDDEAGHLEAALALRPEDGRLRARFARNLDVRGLSREALEEAARAAAAAPDDAFVRAVHGRILMGNGALEKALAEYEAADRAMPGQPEVVARVIACLRALGRPAEALARIDRALARRPDEAPLLLEKALILVEMPGGDRAAAAAAVRRARALGAAIPPELEVLPR